jgi:hypothetical protein
MLEPAKGVFNFQFLDDVMAAWGAAGKKITLVIKTSPEGGAEINPWANSPTPQWVYDEGARYVTSPSTGQQIPVSWDPIFLSEYQQFLQQFAAHYDGNPAIEYIIVGPGVFYSTRVAYPADIGAFQAVGYTDQLWYQTNLQIMAMYENAFQMTHLALGMGPFVSDSTPMNPVYNEFNLGIVAAHLGMYVSYHNLRGTSSWVDSPYPAFFSSLGTLTKVALGLDNPISGGGSDLQTYGDPMTNVQYAFGGVDGLPPINTYYLEFYADDVTVGTPGSGPFNQDYADAQALFAENFLWSQPVVTGTAVGAPEVRVYDALTGAIRLDFMAYNAGFQGGVRVATGDITRTGHMDIVTAPGPGGGPDIRVFDGVTGALIREFAAFSPGFLGGEYVAVGDVNGDGYPDIIVGADAGGGPQVEVFSGRDGSLLRSFYAFGANFTGGVRVAAGDVNGDGYADIITAPGAGGEPYVAVFSGADGSLLQGFFAYDPRFLGGVYVAAGDVNGDGKADIITGTGAGGAPLVNVFSGADGSLLQSFMTLGGAFTGGVQVSAVDFLGTGRMDVLVGAGPGGGPAVQIYDGMNQAFLDGFFAYDQNFPGGVFVGG